MKYLFDRIVSALGLFLLSPVFLVVAVLIRIKMPGAPVIFRQQRVGLGGQLFTLHKFRSMAPLSRSDQRVSVAAEEQQRITPLGEKLRRYKLDELPELWDVLRGKMSFVGPRPDVPGYADALEGDDREVLLLRPGITGPASLKYRDEEQMLLLVGERLRFGEKILLPDGRQVHNVSEYNDWVIYPDKVRLNRYYLHHRTFIMDLRMIVATVLGHRMYFAGEQI